MGVEQEFAGRDLEEALLSASRALGVGREALDFRLLDEGRRGLFGLGAKSVRIAVKVPDAAAPAVEERPRPAPPKSDDAGPAARSVEETLGQMLALTGLALEARTETDGDAVKVFLSGPDRKLLLQKDGELMNALQFLLSRMARRAWPGVAHVVVACEGFRDHREDDLVELVREVARQVARTGHPKKLHSMNPYERRLVHITVREFPELTSRSAGDGFLKQVTVAPAARGSGA
jgi:spoIIIJ-associated protein